MTAAVEIVFAFLAGIGLLGLGWLLFGRLLTPAGDAQGCAVVPARGDGEELEQAVAGLLWLRGGGLLRGHILLADCGLSDTGRAVALALCQREADVALCPAAELEAYIRGETR